VDQSAIGSPNDPNPAYMSYEEYINNNNIELKNKNKVFLDSYSYISFVNCDILPEMGW
jgi:hypothetical protein